MNIPNSEVLKEIIDSGPCAWPGGYPLYFLTKDGSVLSFNTVKKNLYHISKSIDDKNDNGWFVVVCDINWEDDQLIDDDTGELIESAYCK